MKKLVLLAALLAASGLSQAEDTATLYGVLDLGVANVAHSLSIDNTYPASVHPFNITKSTVNTNVTGMVDGGMSGNRWGIRGSEDLGNGTKAIFALESGLILSSGNVTNAAASLAANAGTGANSSVSANSSQDGQLFDRQAWVGLQDSTLGTVKLGRVYLPEFDIVQAYDPVGSQLLSPISYSGTFGGGGGVSDVQRSDNSVRYENALDGVKFGGLFKFGQTAGNFNQGRAVALNAGTTIGPVSFEAAMQQNNDAIKSSSGTTLGTLTGTAYNIRSYMIGAKVNLDKLVLSAGAEKYTLGAASDNMSHVTSLYGYATTTTSYTGVDQDVYVYWLGGKYQVTDKLNARVGVYEQQLRAYGNTADGQMVTYAALVDYNLSKRTDVYAGANFSNYSGGLYATGYNTCNSIVLTGIRHVF
jgi:general bacterial porin, GBP family